MGKSVAAKSPVWPKDDLLPDRNDGPAVEAWTNRRLDNIPDEQLIMRLRKQLRLDIRRLGKQPKEKGWTLHRPFPAQKTRGRYNGTFKKSWMRKMVEVSLGRAIMKLVREMWLASFKKIKGGRNQLTIAGVAHGRLQTKYNISVPKHLLGP